MEILAGNEYITVFSTRPYGIEARIIVTAVDKDSFEYKFTSYLGNHTAQFSDVKSMVSPVTSKEMNSLDEATLIEELESRRYVQYGEGKLTPDDYAKYDRIMFSTENPFQFKVGEQYKTQNDNLVTVLGRTDTNGYECLICSDGIYRYDRSNTDFNNPDKGRATGSNFELMDPNNFLNPRFGNRYVLAKNFALEYAYSIVYVLKSQNILNDRTMRKSFLEYTQKYSIDPIF